MGKREYILEVTLFDAMEAHGNAEGTETQLGDANEFLRLALGMMTSDTRSKFLHSDEVSEIISREIVVFT